MPLTNDEILAKFQESRDNALMLIIEITTHPKPSYNIDNQQVDWGDYLKLLQSTVDSLESKIDKYLPPISGEETGYC